MAMKMFDIGQSAAKSLGSFEPFNPIMQENNFFDDAFCQISASSRHEAMALKTQFSLRFFPMQIGEDLFEKNERITVVPSQTISNFAGFEFFVLNIPVGVFGDEFDSFSFAHHKFNSDSVLKTRRSSIFSGEFSNSDTPFSIENTGDISSNFGRHGSFLRETSNDYPEMEYTQVGGRTGQHILSWNAADDIVFSSVKAEAVRNHQTDGAENNESARKYKAYLGDDYYALAWPTTLRGFKNNLETIHQYTDTGFKLIMNGEIGRYENVRYVEQTNIAKGTGTDGITQTTWSQGKSDWIFFFGNDTVAEAIAVPEEMRGKIPTDYGRSKGVAWYYLGGFGIVHTLAANVRIVKWDSLV